MTDDADARIDELQLEAGSLPAGPTKVSLLEEAVRLADSLGDVPRAYEVRNELMEAATFSNRSDILLVTFAWCLAQYDRDPQQFDEHEIMWKYKWVVSNATDFAAISRAQIEEMLADMQRRFDNRGYSLHAPFQIRRDVAITLGDVEAACTAHERFLKTRSDWLSDCNACVPSNNITYYAFQGDYRKALQAAKPLLEGKLSCAEEPRRAYGEVLRPLLHLGRAEEAKEFHAQGYKLLGKAEHAVGEFAQHLEFVALVGDMAKAKKMFERRLPAALETVIAIDRYHFLKSVCILFDVLLAQGTTSLKVRLPADLAVTNAEGQYDVAELRAWFAAEAYTIAAQYDARDGNDYYVRGLDELPEVLKLGIPA